MLISPVNCPAPCTTTGSSRSPIGPHDLDRARRAPRRSACSARRRRTAPRPPRRRAGGRSPAMRSICAGVSCGNIWARALDDGGFHGLNPAPVRCAGGRLRSSNVRYAPTPPGHPSARSIARRLTRKARARRELQAGHGLQRLGFRRQAHPRLGPFQECRRAAARPSRRTTTSSSTARTSTATRAWR